MPENSVTLGDKPSTSPSENKLPWPWVLTAVGGILVLISLFWVRHWQEDSPTGKVLARATEPTGQIFLLKKFWTEKKKMNKEFSIYSLDSVETGANSEVVLEFPTAYRLKVSPLSQVTLEETSSSTAVIIKSGDVQVLNFGREGSLFVFKNGRKESATDFELAKQSSDSTSARRARGNSSASSDRLSQEDLQGTLQKHRPVFFKCYSQLLQKTPGITGQASLAFTIEKSGKISQPEVTNSSIADGKFKSCLIEALERIEFKSFSGDPISTVFPLRFE